MVVEGTRRNRPAPRIVAFAVLCIAVLAAGVVASASATRAKTLGHTKNTPSPSCPAPKKNANRCQVVGSVTAFQAEGDGKKRLMVAPQNGKLIAWAIDLSKPNAKESGFFGKLFRDGRFGDDPSARIAVLKPKGHHEFRLLRESPAVDLQPYLGQKQFITLGRPLRLRKGQILALTLPTWAPAFNPFVNQRDNKWVASRPPPSGCNVTAKNADASRPQQKVGSIRKYKCSYAARILYWGYYIPS